MMPKYRAFFLSLRFFYFKNMIYTPFQEYNHQLCRHLAKKSDRHKAHRQKCLSDFFYFSKNFSTSA